jgi:hypothetical protein
MLNLARSASHLFHITMAFVLTLMQRRHADRVAVADWLDHSIGSSAPARGEGGAERPAQVNIVAALIDSSPTEYLRVYRQE